MQTSIQEKNESNPPVFSMHNDKIMSIRKGDYKLFVNKPHSRKKVDLSTWSDSRGPDGTTIIAQMEGQATPADYPGIRPEEQQNKIQLFNLKTDPTESNDLAASQTELVKELMKVYEGFKLSQE